MAGVVAESGALVNGSRGVIVRFVCAALAEVELQRSLMLLRSLVYDGVFVCA